MRDPRMQNTMTLVRYLARAAENARHPDVRGIAEEVLDRLRIEKMHKLLGRMQDTRCRLRLRLSALRQLSRRPFASRADVQSALRALAENPDVDGQLRRAAHIAVVCSRVGV